MALQQLIPLLGQVSSAARPLLIDKVTVLPDDGGSPGDGAARSAIRFAEQLRSSMGIDLASIAKRFQAEGQKK